MLSVGDLEFQKKCLGKMGEVAKGGRTIIFVSHQMNQIRRLCDRILWIEGGRLRCQGPTSEMAAKYEVASSARVGMQEERNISHVKAYYENWEISEPSGVSPNVLSSFGPIAVQFTLHVVRPVRNAQLGLFLYSADRQILWGTQFDGLQLQAGRHALIQQTADTRCRCAREPTTGG